MIKLQSLNQDKIKAAKRGIQKFGTHLKIRYCENEHAH